MILLITLQIMLKAFSFLFFPYFLRILLIITLDFLNLIFIKDRFFKYFPVFLSLFFLKNFEFFNSNLLKDEIYLIEGNYREPNRIKAARINNKEVSKNITIIFRNDLKLNYFYIKAKCKIKKEIFNRTSGCYFAEIISIESIKSFPIREYIREIIFNLTSNCDKITYRFFNSIVLGEQYRLDKNILKIFKATGLMHILALSGLHFHLLAYIFTLILSLFRLNKNLERAILFLLLTLYFFAAQFSPSLLRAYLMESFRILSKILGEKEEIFKSFCLSLILSLIINKSFLLELSFQMSYLATLAILLAIKRTKNIIYINLIIFIFTAPLQLTYFKSINLSSIFYNLLFVPIFSMLIKLMFLSVIISMITFRFNFIVSLILSKIINLLFAVLEFLADKFVLKINFNFIYLISFLIFILLFLFRKDIYERFKKFFLLAFK